MPSCGRSVWLLSESDDCVDVKLSCCASHSLGRSPLTRIKHARISRNHVMLDVQCSSVRVSLCGAGLAHRTSIRRQDDSRVDLPSDQTPVVLDEGDVLWLLDNQFGYRFSRSGRTELSSVKVANKRQSPQSNTSSKRFKAQTLFECTQVNGDANARSLNADCKSRPDALCKSPTADVADKLSNLQRICATSSNLVESKCVLAKGWSNSLDNVFMYSSGEISCSPQDKLAAFDMDGTLIRTKGVRPFPIDRHDWEFIFPSVPAKLRQMYDDGYHVIIFTNQLGISMRKQNATDIRAKLEMIIAQVGVPATALVAPTGDKYRKPCVGMFDHLISVRGCGVDIEQSVYVGDAAGRNKGWKCSSSHRDHSCDDRLFALNLGIRFLTPEEFFCNEAPTDKFTMPVFDPRAPPPADLLIPTDALTSGPSPEMVVLVGSPASGKSTFCRTHLVPLGYERVNRDTLGTWQKCVAAAETALSGGSSVAIDNTNGDVASRARYTELARRLGVTARCFAMTTSKEHSFHNERFRRLTQKASGVTDVVIHTYWSRYVTPTLEEGFTQIVKVNFVPSFTSEEQARLYRMFLSDKIK